MKLNRPTSRIIDLRSDTVTRPTPGMRRAMARAEVDDDIIGHDPTTMRLEERSAELLGKEAALFVPSGTMGNQIAVKIHTKPGQQILCSETAHVANWEVCMCAALSGVQPRLVPSPLGYFTAEAARTCIPPDEHYYPRTGLICIENTMNTPGGRVFPQAEIAALARLGRRFHIPLHMDGARLFNAAVASGRSPSQIVRPVHSVCFCLSKGLGTPAGTILAGSRDFVREARRVRQMLGGGMRQTGILAAAGLYALDHHIDRLAEDHATARRFAEGLAEIPGMALDLEAVETNMVYFDPTGCGITTAAFVEAMARYGVRMLHETGPVLRAVTHLQVTRRDIDHVLDAARKVVRRKLRRRR
ncbi:MAG: aminotransferase class I/II-fold pyridoxal phosphate-dependent enzyme [Planctomycetes bacterium]|nr:aminotransferase class I/II-fold pyridoxal phosphate-dependent enzyme [Planctomycetota bacterium]